jgi:succinate-semialdehyde dehydrogenase/glutarate-semialdehyde dehydrogenase
MTDQVAAERETDAKTRTIQTVNPATGQPGRTYEEVSIGDAKAAAAAARKAFESWRRTSFAERSAVIRKAAEVLRRRKDEFAALMTEEMGKTLTDGRAEVEKCAFHCD